MNTTQLTPVRGAPRAQTPADPRPRLIPEPAESPPDLLEQVARLRRFFHGDAEAAEQLEKPGDGWLPALMYPCRDVQRLRTDYPLFLYPDDEDEQVCTPLGELLRQRLDSLASGPDDLRLARDNLKRLERFVRDELGEAPTPQPAGSLIRRAAEKMLESLSLRPEPAEALRGELETLIDSLPAGGTLLALTDATSLQLLLHVAARTLRARQSALRKELGQLAAALRDLLRLGRSEQVDAGHVETLEHALGGCGAEKLDAAELARVLGRSRRGASWDAARQRRITRALETIRAFLDQPPRYSAIVVFAEGIDESWKRPDVRWEPVAAEQVLRGVAERFDAQAGEYAKLFAAARVARLELRGAYDPARHDRLAQTFDWRAFSRDELLSLPAVIGLVPAEHACGAGLAELSRLLRSRRPVSVVVPVPAAGVGRGGPTLQNGKTAAGRAGAMRQESAVGEAGGDDVPLELGYLGIAHREAFVHQSSSARPEHLARGYRLARVAACTALHVVTTQRDSQGREPRLGPWLHDGAAIEGRAYPLLIYNPQAGVTWASRFDLSHNPQPEDDWPTGELVCLDGEQEQTRTLAFTFADFALLEPPWRDHFRVIPDTVPAEPWLTPLAEFAGGEVQAAVERVPFICATDEQGRLRRLAVSRALALRCRDRLEYWHTLRELAGIRNEYVRGALQRQRAELEQQFAAEREQLIAEHTQELERVRRETAAEAMQRLAAALLEADLESLPAAGTAASCPAAPAEPPAAPPGEPGAETAPAGAQAEVEQEQEEEVSAEPWIASALCTSCNDCINLNPQMFRYNANKQAYIADPRAGTYAQLVEAAEKCPARCIHPGLPLNPDEPNLDALIERAKKFN